MIIDYIVAPYKHFYKDIFCNEFNAKLIDPCKSDEINSMSPDANKIFLFAERNSLQYILKANGKGKNIIFFRRHELYDNLQSLIIQSKHKFTKVYTLNNFLQNKLKIKYNIDSEIEKNYIDERLWDFKTRQPGNKIAWVGELKDRKAPDFLIEVANHFKAYEFHCAISPGPSKELYLDFIKHYDLKNITLHENIKTQEQMNTFLNDKNYLITTSISEGLPNCVLEALVKGIKPIVRNYPGCVFEKFSYNSLREIEKHLNSTYNSNLYRKLIEENYGLNQFLLFKNKILSYEI